jgi:hypothetical protein
MGFQKYDLIFSLSYSWILLSLSQSLPHEIERQNPSLKLERSTTKVLGKQILNFFMFACICGLPTLLEWMKIKHPIL